jgi:hypothetical protein
LERGNYTPQEKKEETMNHESHEKREKYRKKDARIRVALPRYVNGEESARIPRGRPLPESTLAAVNIIRYGWLWVAGGPEPRKGRYGFHQTTRELSHPIIRVGSPYQNRPSPV